MSMQLIWKFEMKCKQKIYDASTPFGQQEFKNGMIKFYVVMYIMRQSWHWYIHKSSTSHLLCYPVLNYTVLVEYDSHISPTLNGSLLKYLG